MRPCLTWVSELERWVVVDERERREEWWVVICLGGSIVSSDGVLGQGKGIRDSR